jgi:hypothetical protein
LLLLHLHPALLLGLLLSLDFGFQLRLLRRRENPEDLIVQRTSGARIARAAGGMLGGILTQDALRLLLLLGGETDAGKALHPMMVSVLPRVRHSGRLDLGCRGRLRDLGAGRHRGNEGRQQRGQCGNFHVAMIPEPEAPAREAGIRTHLATVRLAG